MGKIVSYIILFICLILQAIKGLFIAWLESFQIDMYLWLEGQDMDCNNSMKDAKILTNIQFAATTIPTSGME